MDVTSKASGPVSQYAASSAAAARPRAEGVERPASDAVVARPAGTTASASTVTESGATRPVQAPVATAPAQQASTEELNTAVEEVQSYVEQFGRKLSFEVDQDTNQTIVRVLDASTGEVVRQIPSEELLALAEALRNNMGGDAGSAAGLLLQAVS